jgi:hypothetical protein
MAFRLLPVLLALPPTVPAQSVAGRVLDDATGAGVQGALVTLVDPSGALVATTVTGPAGSFRIPAPPGGWLTVRAERAGYSIPAARWEAGEGAGEQELVLRAERAPLLLDPVRVDAEGRCGPRPGDGGATADLWLHARRGLLGAAVLQDRELLEFEVHTWVRDISFAAGTARTRESARRTVRGRPFETLGAADLLEHGFVRREHDRLVHHGPDAHLLLSEAFLDAYCFRVAAPRGGLVGLAFEPVRRGPGVGIEGVLWLDAATGELRHLEYRYTGDEGELARHRASGRIEFRELRGGGWIVERWWIRRSAGATRAGDPPPVQVLEAGGEVRRVRWLEGDERRP